LSLVKTAKEIWGARELVNQFVRRDLTVRYHQAVMGFAWALVNPALVVMSGLIIRFAFAKLSGRPLELGDASTLAIKAIPWSFFAGAMSLATVSIVSHANLIGKVYFVRETLPIATVLGQAFDTAIGTASVTLALLVFGFGFSAQALWVIPVTFFLLLFTMGCALLLSCANLFFRDVKYLVQILISFGLFLTPVFFGPEALGPRGAIAMLLFPIATFIQAIGLSVGQGLSLSTEQFVNVQGVETMVWSPWLLAYGAVISICTLLAGLVLFRKFSARFAEAA
jgi:ABC-type polysaccharide/polyol phosphate export permease